MKYEEKLIAASGKSGSILCLGIDPVIEEIPLKEQSPEKKIIKFYSDIIDATEKSVGAAKLNYAFFAQYGFAGLRALKKMLHHCKNKKIITVLDAKRGDIGKSSEAYAKEAFEFWKADAVTVSPYMGTDSVQPFLNYGEKGKGTYVLVKTSNSGSSDFQELNFGNSKLFMEVAAKVKEWNAGAVVGATNIEQLRQINGFFQGKVPLLIPGVGAQGGNAKEVAEALKETGADIRIHRINSSC